MSRKITLPIFVLFILVIVLYLLRGSLAMPIFERVLPKMMGADIRDELANGLNVGVCGAGGPLPDPRRSGACIAVMAGETLLVVDTGNDQVVDFGREEEVPFAELMEELLMILDDVVDDLGRG